MLFVLNKKEKKNEENYPDIKDVRHKHPREGVKLSSFK